MKHNRQNFSRQKWLDRTRLFPSAGWLVLILMLASSLLIPCQDSFAQFVFSDPVPLNTNAASDWGFDWTPQVTTDGLGHWVAVWHSEDTLGGTIDTDYDILMSRSSDHGATWTAPQPLNTNAGSDSGNDYDPQVTTDGLGHWVAVWHSEDTLGGTIDTDYDILVSRSSDHGATWTAPQPLNTNAGSDSGHDSSPQVTTDGQGHWVAVWHSEDTLGGTIDDDRDILVSCSSDNGATWTAPQPLNTNAGSDSGHDSFPQVTTDGMGHWVAVWDSNDPLGGTIDTDTDILVSCSSDNGATWTDPQPLNTNAASDSGWDTSPQVTTDGMGHWVVVWHSGDTLGGTIDDDGDILVLVPTFFAFSDPMPLNTDAVRDWGDDYNPQVTTDGQGHWVAVWASDDSLGGIGTDLDILVSYSDNGEDWTPPTPLNNNAASDSGDDYNPQVTTDGQGHWVAVWQSNDTLGGIGTDLDILMSYSDNGEDWTPPYQLNTNAASDWGHDIDPQVTSNGIGHWLAVWESLDSLDGTIDHWDGDILVSIGRSGDNGVTWEPPQPLNTTAYSDSGDNWAEDYSPHVATDGMGNLVAVWCSDYTMADFSIGFGFGGDDGEILVSHSYNYGKRWEPPQPLDTAPAWCPQVTTDGMGNLVAVWSSGDTLGGTIDDDQDILVSYSGDNGLTWEPPQPLNTNATSDSGDDRSPQVATDGQGHWIAVWASEDTLDGIGTDWDILVSYSDNGKDWTPPTPLNTDATSDSGDDCNPRVTTDGQGHWVAMWQSNDNLGGIGTDQDILVATLFAFPPSAGLKVGEEILLPQDMSWEDIDWLNTTFDAQYVIKIDDAQKLLIRDQGNFSIIWKPKEGDSFRQNYVSVAAAVKEPMVIYYTDDLGESTDAPPVDLSSRVPNVKIHYNEAVHKGDPERTDDDILWMQGGKLYARGPIEKRPALVVLEYNDGDGNFIGIEVVEVKPHNVPDVPIGVVDIGSRLRPYQADPNALDPMVIRGGTESTPPYIYQHPGPDAPQQGQMWAIRKNDDSVNMEVIWMRTGLEGVEWPYELRRYTAKWPDNPGKYQVYVRSTSPGALGPDVIIPDDLDVELQDYKEFDTSTHDAYLDAHPDGNRFHADGPGWALLKYKTGQDWVGFEVVRCVLHTDTGLFDLTLVPWDIGTEIIDPYHQATDPYDHGNQPGYIHDPEGDRYAPATYDMEADGTGQIFAVNKGILEVWWSNLSRTQDPEGAEYPPWPSDLSKRVQWPSKVVRYKAKWPDEEPIDSEHVKEMGKIIIARQNGSGTIAESIYGTDWEVYVQNDPAQPGFNPNDEHAWESGSVIWALRDDLGTPDTSDPYVLMQYKKQPGNNRWGFHVFKVLAKEGDYDFRDWPNVTGSSDPYEYEAGHLIEAPRPLRLLNPRYCEETVMVSGQEFMFRDRNGNDWVKAAGHDGKPTTVTIQYYYPVDSKEEGKEFFCPDGSFQEGDHVPWLDKGTGTPVDVTYTVAWPDPVPAKMKIGQTVIKMGEAGIPSISGQSSVDIIYQQSVEQHGKDYPSVALIDPIQIRYVTLDALPADIEREPDGTERLFPELSPALRKRVRYDPYAKQLKFKGVYDVDTDHALLNVMSEEERDELLGLSKDTAWTNAVGALYDKVKSPIEITDSSVDPHDMLALTSGFAQGHGYVTLIMNNGDDCGAEPIEVYIINVSPELHAGAIQVIPAPCPFDEMLTLRHKGDFGGHPDNYQFEWRCAPDQDGTAPSDDDPDDPYDDPYKNWDKYDDGTGMIDITIKGPGEFTLSDHWFVCRYKYIGEGLPWSDKWSDWTKPQLAEGWIKRVMGKITPYTQRAGGEIESAEKRFFDSYRDSTVNTVVDMIKQAGPRWTGDIPMNCSSLDDFGLIQIYETVLGRGTKLSIDNAPLPENSPVNTALLLAASRISDLYMLLGNEAYADAADPTIAFGTNDGIYGAEASSIHCFMNVTSSLLEEELALLCGRDDTRQPSVEKPPYNRLIWNFTNDITGGEVAYALNYNIQDESGETAGTISEADAEALYPQGHGDAWGHYLTAIKTYYKLLIHSNYTWNTRSEAVLVGEQPVTVDYLDERKFAKAAAAKARTGAEIVNLTYRSAYVEDPSGQWQGYKDTKPERAWGLAEWASRTGLGTYIDWVVGNAVLPPDPYIEEQTAKTPEQKEFRLSSISGVPAGYKFEASVNGVPQEPETFTVKYYSETSETVITFLEGLHEGDTVVFKAQSLQKGIQKIDRTTVLELREVASRFQEIQTQVDTADLGLNPLGLATNVVPFDISPEGINNGQTHFEQIYDRAVTALNNAITVFNHANNSTQLLRRQADTHTEFERTVEEREADFKNRLIEIFGYPYADDIGPGKTYPTGYDGPDLYHYTYVDPQELLGIELPQAGDVDKSPSVYIFPIEVTDFFDVDSSGGVVKTTKQVEFHLSTQEFGFIKPPEWEGKRRAPGEIQMARSDLMQLTARFERAIVEYDTLLQQIEDEADLLQAQHNLNRDHIQILYGAQRNQVALNQAIFKARNRQMLFRTIGQKATYIGNALAEGFPGVLGVIAGMAGGVIADVTSPARAAAKLAASVVSEIMNRMADSESLNELAAQQAKEMVQSQSTIDVTALQADFAIQQQLKQIAQLIRNEASLRLELYTMQEAMQQAAGRYQAALARGLRLQEDRSRFLAQTAAQVQSYRYKDMAFRIFRNDALQKYRAQFDLAARYVYLAAKAYDYETTLLSSDTRSGQAFLTDIVRARLIGTIQDGLPHTGLGLADPMAQMSQNFGILKGQLGFNNPQKETNRFSLRSELFRIQPGFAGNAVWRETLRHHVVPNLLDLPEFQRYARVFEPHMAAEPGIVIPLETNINFGLNFFGWPLGGGDSAYDSTNFTTKVRSVGVWFTNYNNLVGQGMSETPRVYLIPVGTDIQRSPTYGSGEIRVFNILDQRLPVPFDIGESFLVNNPGWIPENDTQFGTFADVRRYSSFRAYHDSGQFTIGEVHRDSRLIGRSVWNTRWLLIIPSGTLHTDRDEGLNRFIDGQLFGGERDGNGVSDIKIFFETYAYSGN